MEWNGTSEGRDGGEGEDRDQDQKAKMRKCESERAEPTLERVALIDPGERERERESWTEPNPLPLLMLMPAEWTDRKRVPVASTDGRVEYCVLYCAVLYTPS